jgi:thiamine pyrophosphokinase
MVGVIVAGGDFYGEIPENYNFLIAADRGLEYCKKLTVIPDLIIGDFDSLGYIPDTENVIVLNSDKDESDTFFAANYAADKGFDELHIFGATGGRFSHTMSNIQTLHYCSNNNIKNFIYDREEILTVISSEKGNSKLVFDENKKGYISIFSLNEKCEVTIKNLKYELEKSLFTNTYPRGLSNEFVGKPAEIEVFGGAILVVYGAKNFV